MSEVSSTESVVEGTNPEVTQAEELIPKKELERTLSDLHKYKQQAKELAEKQKNLELAQMREKQEWQKIAEVKEREAIEFREKYEAMQSAHVFDRKYSAVRDAALKAGIRAEAISDLELLPLNDVQIETTSTGRVNVLGVDDFIRKIKTTRPHWFGTSAARINSDTPEVVTGKKATYEDLIAAEKEAKKTGDYSNYKKMLLEFKQ